MGARAQNSQAQCNPISPSAIPPWVKWSVARALRSAIQDCPRRTLVRLVPSRAYSPALVLTSRCLSDTRGQTEGDEESELGLVVFDHGTEEVKAGRGELRGADEHFDGEA